MTGREQREANVRACLEALFEAIPAPIRAHMPTTPGYRELAHNTIVEVVMGMTEEGPDSPAFQQIVARMRERTESEFTSGFAQGFTSAAMSEMRRNPNNDDVDA